MADYSRGLLELPVDALSNPPLDLLCASWAPNPKMFRGCLSLVDTDKQAILQQELKKIADQYAPLLAQLHLVPNPDSNAVTSLKESE